MCTHVVFCSASGAVLCLSVSVKRIGGTSERGDVWFAS